MYPFGPKMFKFSSGKPPGPPSGRGQPPPAPTPLATTWQEMATEPPFWSLLLWKRSLLLKILTKTLHCTLSCSLRLNFARSLLIFCLVRSVSNSEARSLASASPSSFIFTEGDLINKPIFVTADNRLKYRAICCCINR